MVPGTELILASRSPRRREILSALGVEHTVVELEVEEVAEGEPELVVIENARRKAGAGLALAPEDAVVLGADTEVVLDGEVLGQASGEEEARSHLAVLSGRTHIVLTGVTLLSAGRKAGDPAGCVGAAAERTGVTRSEVTFRDLDRRTVDLYLRAGEWRGRAGAYAIQGLGSILIERLEGDFSNVVGLPVPLLLELAPELFE